MFFLRSDTRTRTEPTHASISYPNSRYAWFVVGVLVVINILSSVDRQLLSLLVTPVRHDLVISDTQISLLQGLAFALFYAVFGLPLGWLADKANRRNIIAAGIVLWSVMTMACGLASTFGGLFAARVGVGIGEAALLPAAYSMIADYFPLLRRGRALSVLTIAQFAGVGVSWGLGGALILFMNTGVPPSWHLIGGFMPWQTAFLIVGLSGILLCSLMLAVREPMRHGTCSLQIDSSRLRGGFFAYLTQHKSTFVPVYAVYALMAFVGYNFQAWLPTYFERRYSMTAAAAGVRIGTVIMTLGTLGCITSGLLGDRWSSIRLTGGRFRVTLIWWAAAFISTCGIFYSSSAQWALFFVGVQNFGASLALASAAASIQDVVPNDMRGMATATYLLLIGIVGFGMGPSAVAIVTDYVFHGDSGLKESLLVVPIPAIVAGALCSLIALRPYQQLYEKVNAP